MTIYVVTSGSYSDYTIRGLFSTRELAQRYVDEYNGQDPYNEAGIEEYELDAERETVAVTTYCVEIKMCDGSLIRAWDYREMGGDKEEPSATLYPSGSMVFARSNVSSDHALKLAAEKRQMILRTKG